jgi:molybdopterin-guanine dinucleotide biosynthesis protein A
MGRPKAWLPIGDALMLPHVLCILGQVTTPLVAVAARDQELPSLPQNTEVVRDEVEGRGPLQGLATGLAAIEGRADAAYLSSCDVPFLIPAFVQRLVDRIGDASACVPRVGGREHPLAAVYRLEILSTVRRQLQDARLRLTDLSSVVATRFVEADELVDVDPTFRSLRNLNTPADYEAALREIAAL